MSLNVRAKTIKILKENIGIKLCDFGFDSGLYQKHNKQQKMTNWISQNQFLCFKDTIKWKDNLQNG